MFEYNPLDVLDKRVVSFIPPHFSKIKVGDVPFIEQELELWIRNKLRGRYFISKAPTIGSDDKLKSSIFVGFEDQKELTYFMLACPYLRRN